MSARLTLDCSARAHDAALFRCVRRDAETPLKIVHVIPALTKGGAERVAVDLANHAASAGHLVTILAAVPAPRELLADRLHAGVRLRLIALEGRNVRMAYARILPWIFRNRRWLFDQDVIHCHLTFGAVFGAVVQTMRAFRGGRSPAVVETYHGVGMAVPRTNRAMHALLLKSRDAVALMAEDPYWHQFSNRNRGQVVRFIPNGISAVSTAKSSDSKGLHERLGLTDCAVIIGSIGRLVVDRRPDILLDVFGRLAKQSSRPIHFILGGEGPLRSQLEGEARRLGVSDRVHLLGLVRDPSEPLALMDLYLSVNVGATTGIAALEAAFADVPIIAVQLDQTYRPKQDDWIWSSADPDEIAAHALHLLNDADSLRQLALRQGRHARAHHSVGTMALAYDQLYEEALVQSGRVDKGSGSASRQC